MLRVECDGPVTTLVIDRPEVRNAFNDELISRLYESVRELPAQTRVLVLRGEGKTFCAGGDLEWMRKAAGYTEEENRADALKLARLYEAIQTAPALVVAQVHGAAFGGGCGLVACADVAIAADDTKFSFSEVKLGLIPATISSFVIPKIGASQARALFMTGEVFLAPRAQQIGLVHKTCPESELPALVYETVRQALTCAPEAVLASRSLVLDAPLSQEETARRLAHKRASAEAREGIGAFLNKRKAAYVVER